MAKLARKILFAFAPAAFIAAPALAQSTSFARCDRLEAERKLVHAGTDDAEKLRTMDGIVTDMESLHAELDKKTPSMQPAFLSTCYLNKEEVFASFLSTHKSKLDRYPEWYRLVGRHALLKGDTMNAFKAFNTAVRMDPKDYPSLRIAFEQWFKDQMFRHAQKEKEKTPMDLQKFHAEASQIIKSFLDNPAVPKSVKADLLKLRARLFEGTMISQSNAQFDFQKMLELDPNNVEALKYAAAYAYDRKNWEEARSYFDRLAPRLPDNVDVQKKNLELMVHFGEEGKVLRLASGLAKKWPRQPYFHAAEAWAQFRAGQLKPARAANERALKLDRKEPFARATQAVLLEKEGDEFLAQELVGAALASYNDSYGFNPKNVSVRKKMATLIYDTHKAAGFAGAASRKDMDRLMELLDPIFSKNILDKSHVEVYILASAQSSVKKKGARACEYYSENYAVYPTVELVVTCVRAHKAAGNAEAAQKLVQEALKNPRLQAGQTELKAELLKRN